MCSGSSTDRPNALWVSDFAYVSTWQGLRLLGLRHRRFRPPDRWLARLVVGADRIRSRRAGAGAACAQAVGPDRLVHSDRGVQYVSIRYTERLAEAGLEPSVIPL